MEKTQKTKSQKHLLQSDLWKRVKKDQGYEIIEFSNGWLQVSYLPIIKLKIGYIPRIDVNLIDFYELNELAKRHKLLFITVDPSNAEKDIDQSFYENNKVIITKSVQPRETLVLSLDKSLGEIEKSFRSAHRQYYRRAERKGVITYVTHSDTEFKNFLKMYAQIQKKYSFKGRSERYLEQVWNSVKDFDANNNTKYRISMTSYFENEPIVSWFAIAHGNTFYGIYGGSVEKGNKLKAAYSHTWKAIQWAHKQGYTYFDFWGLTEDKESGYSRFKLGFGGEQLKYASSFDIVSNILVYYFIKLIRRLLNIRK